VQTLGDGCRQLCKRLTLQRIDIGSSHDHCQGSIEHHQVAKALGLHRQLALACTVQQTLEIGSCAPSSVLGRHAQQAGTKNHDLSVEDDDSLSRLDSGSRGGLSCGSGCQQGRLEHAVCCRGTVAAEDGTEQHCREQAAQPMG